MDLVDTHCHIQSIGTGSGERTTREIWAKESGLTPEEVIKNADEHGVTRLICVGCDLIDSKLAIDFVKNKERAWASIGIHPHEAQHFANNQKGLDEFSELVKQDKVVSVGECGLDYFYTHSPKEDQIKVLKFQIELALNNNLPIIFHVREAFNDFWPIFDSYKGIRGVLHSFTDNRDNLDEAIKRGLYIGVNGIATFAKSEDQKDVYRNVPIKRLLLETDSPFLTPVPFRGTINQPMRVGVIADFLSALRNEDRAYLAEVTTNNAKDLFSLK
jgi:TatD DNase family protein